MDRENSLRERLIDVGVDLVMTDGGASLGLREIARRAGVSHGAPRRHFPTHHALLSAIAHRGFEDLGARFATALAATGSPRDQLRAVGRAYVGYALEHRGMFELMFRHDLLDSERNGEQQADRPRLRESTRPLFEGMVALVDRCRAGSATADAPSPAVAAAALWANLHGIAQLWTYGSLQLVLGTTPAPTPDSDHLDRLIGAALDAHLGPVRP
ncbi:TetR/AcrR family transcriptional regulator [Kitasatospora sp. NPDC008050]|uniref:TetR/AcrR family transcriptional regulator n=1 Tax=Kitasatospora sp. NPDC008050 TaxID=3364021 RepID=UPI0036E15D55